MIDGWSQRPGIKRILSPSSGRLVAAATLTGCADRLITFVQATTLGSNASKAVVVTFPSVSAPREAVGGHSSVAPALRSPGKNVASAKSRTMGAAPCHTTKVFI